MVRRSASLLIILLTLFVGSNILAEDYTEDFGDGTAISHSSRPDSVWDDYNVFVGGFGYLYNENSQIGSFNIEVLQLLANKKIEYRFGLAPISFVKRESSVYRYSFQLPVSLISLGMGVLLHNMSHKGGGYKPLEKPDFMTSLLMSPNSSLQFQLRKGFLIGISTQTDFLFYRDHEGDRGILFTPALTFTGTRDNMLVGRGGFTIAVTHSSFLNFDGDNKADGFGLRLFFYGDLNAH